MGSRYCNTAGPAARSASSRFASVEANNHRAAPTSPTARRTRPVWLGAASADDQRVRPTARSRRRGHGAATGPDGQPVVGRRCHGRCADTLLAWLLAPRRRAGRDVVAAVQKADGPLRQTRSFQRRNVRMGLRSRTVVGTWPISAHAFFTPPFCRGADSEFHLQDLPVPHPLPLRQPVVVCKQGRCLSGISVNGFGGTRSVRWFDECRKPSLINAFRPFHDFPSTPADMSSNGLPFVVRKVSAIRWCPYPHSGAAYVSPRIRFAVSDTSTQSSP